MQRAGSAGWSGWNLFSAAYERRLSSLVLALALGVAGRTHAATNVVTSLADNGPGSLRKVIAGSAPGDTIVFAVAGTITLSDGELLLDRALTVNGPGASFLAISGGYTSRVLRVATNVSASLSGLTLCNGRTSGDPGGGIHNAGRLSLRSCVVTNNATSMGATGAGAPGGGIYNVGVLVLEDCTFNFNWTASGVKGTGGGDNGAAGGSGGAGGGIWNGGDMSASQCLVSDNATGSGGDGSSGRVNGGGGGAGGTGGGIFNVGTMTLMDCTVSNNVCGYGGSGGTGQANGGSGGSGGAAGGIYTVNVVLSGCTVVGNRSGSGGSGGSANNGGNGGGGGYGGGVYGWGRLLLTNCTIAGNVSGGGGMSGVSPPWSPVYGGSGGNGAGVYSDATNFALVACSIARNSAGPGGQPGGPYGGAGAPGRGGGVYCGIAGMVLNTLIALNSGLGSNVWGIFSSGGHNLVGTTNSSAGFGGATDLAGSDASPLDPKIGAIGNYGGPAPTVPLLAGSPAIDTGVASGIPAADQRGVVRPQGRGADIGAFEFQFDTPLISGARWLSNSGFWMQACGLPGQVYKVQISSNLVNWLDTAAMITGPEGMGEFTDSPPAGSFSRCYRLKAPMPAENVPAAVSPANPPPKGTN